MSLRSWLIKRLGGNKRQGPPIDIVPSSSRNFGPGVMTQPDHRVLLRENIGIPDAATRAIANRLASLIPEVKVTRRVQEGTEEDEILDDHPLAALLQRPHPNLTLSQVLRLTGQWIVTVGEAYWLKVGSGFRVPVELHPIPPTMVEPQVTDNVLSSYLVTDADGSQRSVPARDFVRFWFPDPENPWRSEGYLAPSGIQVDSHKFASQHLRSHYQHDATPPVVLKAGANAQTFTEEERRQFYALWREYYSTRGGTRAGLPVMLPTDWDAMQFSMQTGADITPLLEHWRDDLLIMMGGVPRSVLGQVVSGDRSSAETNQWVFDRYAVQPIADMVADGLTIQLATDFDASLKVCFQPFVSEDKEYELKRELQDLVQMVRTVNEVRVSRGEDEVPWGDDPIGTSADVPYDPEAATERANRPPPPPAGPGTDSEAESDTSDEKDEERIAHIRLRQQHRKLRKARRPEVRQGGGSRERRGAA